MSMRLDSLQVHQDVLSDALLLTGATLYRHTVLDVVEAHSGSVLPCNRIFGDDSLSRRPIHMAHVLNRVNADMILLTLHLMRLSLCINLYIYIYIVLKKVVVNGYDNQAR